MKLALAVVGDQVSCHFGSCESFTICEIHGTEITAKQVIGTEGNTHGALPGYLAGVGVNAVIAATMGGGAMRKLADLGIVVYPGVQGQLDDVLKQYLNGELTPTEYNPEVHVCNHSHEGEKQHDGLHQHDKGHGCSCGGK